MKNRVYKIDNIRALAIISVVLGHSIILYSSSWNIYTSTYSVIYLDYLKRFINIYQMPLFFSLSGFLFFNTINKNISFIKFVFNKFKRLIIPFISIAFLWMIPIKFFLKYNNYLDKNILSIFKLLITGYDAGHLWYLPVLFLIFVLFYLIILILKRMNLLNYKISDIIIILFCILFRFISHRFYFLPVINNVLDYFLFFYLGYVINKYKLFDLNVNNILKVFIILLTLILIVYNLIHSNNIFNIIVSTLLIINLYLFIPNKEYKLLKRISDNSFGIYLLHSPLIYFTYTYFNNCIPFLVVFINFVLFGMLSFYLTEIINNSKLKFVLGN